MKDPIVFEEVYCPYRGYLWTHGSCRRPALGSCQSQQSAQMHTALVRMHQDSLGGNIQV